MAATVTEIAKQAGVSKGLVSRLLKGDPTLRVSHEKRKHVLEVSSRLGGVKKGPSNGPGRKKKLAYNFVVPCMGKDVFDQIKAHLEIGFFGGLRGVLKENGFRLSMTLMETEEGLDAFKDLVNTPGYCDGFLFLPESSGDVDKTELAELIRYQQFPHVCYDIAMEPYGFNTVYENGGMGIGLAIEHLKQLGHTRIGYLGRKGNRYEQFCGAMGRHRLPICDDYDCVSPKDGAAFPYSAEGWRDAARISFGEVLDKGTNATAMVCHNDYGALGAIDAMRDRDLVAGKDISIVGYDNIEVRGPQPAEEPILSTIDFRLETVGRRCGELLINQVLLGQKQIVHENLPVEFVVRETTGPCQV